MFHEIIQLTVYGIISGGIFALGGIGLSLTYGILKFANFAHGDTMTAGAFSALALMPFVFVLGILFLNFSGIQ